MTFYQSMQNYLSERSQTPNVFVKLLLGAASGLAAQVREEVAVLRILRFCF